MNGNKPEWSGLVIKKLDKKTHELQLVGFRFVPQWTCLFLLPIHIIT